MRDWLHGIRAAEPDKEMKRSLVHQQMTEAERYRIVYEMITSPTEEGGAGVIPKQEPWKNVESIFPLHDHKFNKEWIKKWSTVTFLKPEDLDEIRDRFGEKVKVRSVRRKTKAHRWYRSPFTLHSLSHTLLFWFSLLHSASRRGYSWATTLLSTPSSTACGVSRL